MELFGFLAATVIFCVGLLGVQHYCPIINIDGTSGVDVNGQVTVTTILSADQVQKIIENVSNAILDQQEAMFVRFLRLHDMSGKPNDCQDIEILGYTTTGVYTIYPTGSPKGFQVRCDMETDGGGWTVIQRRLDGSTDFHRKWNEYQVGFGSANNEYWLGNQLIHLLTNRAWYELRIDMTDTDGVSKFVKYNVFRVDDLKNGYRLFLDGFNTKSDIEDVFSYHSGKKFSTHDRDTYEHTGSCPERKSGGWWYIEACYPHLNINGKYGGQACSGFVWAYWKKATGRKSLSRAAMKIRRYTK